MKSELTDKYKLYSPLLGFLCLFNSAPLLAAEDELFFEMPVVLSANRLEQPVSDAAVSISVIDRETIEASGARTIPEVLRLVPGIQVGYSGNEFGDEPKYVVTYHGHSEQYSKQMQVLVDGRSIILTISNESKFHADRILPLTAQMHFWPPLISLHAPQLKTRVHMLELTSATMTLQI